MEKSTDRELLHLAKRVLFCIHADRLQQLCSLCTPDALLKYGHRCSALRRDAEDVVLPFPSPVKISWHQPPYIHRLSIGSAVVTGAYRAQPSGIVDTSLFYMDCTILFSGGKAAYIQISYLSPAERLHRVSAINRDVYCLYESDILYLEVFRSHLHWHHRNRVIESLGTLSGAAECLSEDFIRVHRCYIVNKNHVENICRRGGKQCSLTMDNGDEIPVPYNKFVSCRDQLTRPARAIPFPAALTPD